MFTLFSLFIDVENTILWQKKKKKNGMKKIDCISIQRWML